MENVTWKSGYGQGSVALSADGRFVFHDAQQFNARDLNDKRKAFPGHVLGATADLAMTEKSICDIETAEVVDNWGYKAAAIGVSQNGDRVVTYDSDQRELVIYGVEQ